jgi:hypothetical protein
MRPSLALEDGCAIANAVALARRVRLRAAAFVVSLSLPLSVQGSASGVASLWHSGT